MSSKTLIRIVSILVILAMLPLATTNAAPPSQGKITLVLASDNPMGNVSPFYTETWVGGMAITYVYDSLFLRTPDLQIIPGLATGYKLSEDGLTYTVDLRDGVKWHDGKPFTADDVVFTYLVSAGMGGSRGASLKSLITETLKAVTPTQVEFHLRNTNPFFADRGFTIEVMPKHIWEPVFNAPPETGKTVYDSLHDFVGMVGTGPYKFVEMERDQTYRFVRNDDYWGPKAEVDELVFTVIRDRSVMMQALSAGEVDFVLISIDPTAVEALQKDPNITIVRGPDLANYSLFFECTTPPFDKKVVRQAVAQAVDIDKLVELITLGLGVKMTAGFPSPSLWWAPKDMYHKYDVAAANKLLDDAGYKMGSDGFRTTPEGARLATTLIADSNSPTEVRTAELIKGMLAQIGMEVTPNPMNIDSGVDKVWPGYSAKNPRDYQATIWHWSIYPMVNRWATPMLWDPRFDGIGWANISGYTNPELQTLDDIFLTSPSPEKQREAELKIFDIIAEDVPFVPLFTPAGVFAYRNTKYKHAAYLLGTGIHNRWSFLPDSAWKGIAPATPAGVEPTPTPVPPPTAVPPTKAPAPTQAPPQPTPVPAAAEGGTSPWVWVVVVAAVVILAAVFFVLRKKRA